MVKKAFQILIYVFLLQAMIFTFGGFENVTYHLDLEMLVEPRPALDTVMSALKVLGSLLGAASWAVAWGLFKRRKWSRPAGIAVSIASLLTSPVGAALGIFSLVVLTSRHASEVIQGVPEEARTPSAPESPWSYLVATIVGLAIVLWLSFGGRVDGLPAVSPFDLIIALTAGTLLHTAVHEAGHLAAGWAVGWKFAYVCVGPVHLERDPEGFKLSWNTAHGWLGGFAATVPKSTDNLRKGLIAFCSGGPVATLLFTGVCVTAYVAFPGPYSGLFASMLVVSLLALTGTIVPQRIRGHATDALRVWHLVRGGVEARRFTAAFACALTDTSPLRPRDWKPEWIADRLAIPEKSRDHMSACYHAYLHNLDRGDIAEAGRALDAMLQILPGFRKELAADRFQLEAAYFEARHRSNPAAARKWFGGISKSPPLEKFSIERGRAALELAEGNSAAGEQSLKRASEALSRSRPNGFTAFERDLLEDLKGISA